MGEKGPRSILAVLFVSLVVDLLGFTVILPLLPSILEYYSKKEEVLYGRSYVSLGVITALSRVLS